MAQTQITHLQWITSFCSCTWPAWSEMIFLTSGKSQNSVENWCKMLCNNPKLDIVLNLVEIHYFFLKISSLKRIFLNGGDKYCMQWDYSYRLSAPLICFPHLAPRYARPYVILPRGMKQEAHGPQLAHLSETATADMQMACNIFPILLW